MFRNHFFLSLFLFVCAFAVHTNSRAETKPATPIGAADLSYSTRHELLNQTHTGYATPLAACQSWKPQDTVTWDNNYKSYRCLDGSINFGSVWGVCANGGTASLNQTTYQWSCSGYKCDAGWTLSGSTCTRPDCPAPQVRDGSGACVCPPSLPRMYNGECRPNCSAGTVTKGQYYEGVSPCLEGCASESTDVTVCISSSCYGDTKTTGATCTGNNIQKLTTTVTQCNTGSVLTAVNVNGTMQEACVPSKDPAVKVTAKDTTSNTTTDSATNKTVSTTENASTSCTGGQCTTTTTTTTATTDNGTGQTTTQTQTGTSTQSQPSFCAQNPGAGVCKEDKGTYTAGSCTVAPSCAGDAIACGIAYQAWQTQCALNKASSLSQLGEQLAAGQDTVTNPRDQKTTVNVATALDQTETFAAKCPSDLRIRVNGEDVVLPMDKACGPLTWLGNIGVAFALLVGAMIVIGGIKGT